MSHIAYIGCHIREVAYLLDLAPCDKCGHPAERYSTAQRTAVDIDLDHPVLLQVTMSVHRCATCAHYFRAQPPFLRPDAIYTNRVVTKAVDAVFRDHMAMRTVPARLARDFWVQPSESMIRHWCRAYAAQFDFVTDYQPWVVGEFSGVLCVDEVYEGEIALLLAVDPAAPDGDRLIGYQLLQGNVNGDQMAAFLATLQAQGIEPEQVITDGSALYPSALRAVWPMAAHQLCLFHESRRVTKAVLDVLRQLRQSLPLPPGPAPKRPFGRLAAQPPSDDPTDPATQRWQARYAVRQDMLHQVHTLHHAGLSQRAIARQVGLNRRTVKVWLTQDPDARPGEEPPADIHQIASRDLATTRREARHTKQVRVRQLAAQGLSASEIGRQVGIHRVTVKKWLQSIGASDRPEEAPSSPSEEGSCPTNATTPSGATANGTGLPVEPLPPTPWESWEQVRQIRDALWEDRFLFVTREEHLTAEQHARVVHLLTSPIGSALQTARTFLLDWFALWQDDTGQRRTVEEAQARYLTWRTEATYTDFPALQRIQRKMTDAFFERLSSFLRNPLWEATNNGAERMGRLFRHDQAPHFNRRTTESIEAALVIRAIHRRDAYQHPASPANRSSRGRKAASFSILAEAA